jgi:hypothetical protein
MSEIKSTITTSPPPMQSESKVAKRKTQSRQADESKRGGPVSAKQSVETCVQG